MPNIYTLDAPGDEMTPILNILWTHFEHIEDMPKIWQNLKNMNDSVTDSFSNMSPRNASASKKSQDILE